MRPTPQINKLTGSEFGHLFFNGIWYARWEMVAPVENKIKLILTIYLLTGNNTYCKFVFGDFKWLRSTAHVVQA